MTSKNTWSASPRIGLALAGGGPLAAVYEIGALAALEEAIDGFDANDADCYVGISAGGIVAAGLANGITPHQMVRLFIESDIPSAEHPASELFRPEMLMKPATAELTRRLASLPGLVLASLLHYARRRQRTRHCPRRANRVGQAIRGAKAVLNGV